jgi:predicted  nucleic acid-binding Zn ribbon protein
VLALGVLAISAAACEGGGSGGKELTSLATVLSGGGKEGEEITVAEGTKVKDKATLTGKNASKATGTVKYKIYSEKECKSLVKEAGEVTVSGESVPASSEEELEAGKAYYWQAHYGGDSTNAESTSPCTELLKVQAKTSLSTKLSGESKEGEELTILEGSKAKDTATLSGTNSSTAGGKILYKVFSEKECKTLVTEAGEVTVSSGSVPASSEEELEGGKTYYWQAIYKGDSLHQESTSTCGKEVLNVKAKTSLSTDLSSEGEEWEELAILEGSKAKDTATLSGTNSSSATGKVLYKIYSDNECTKLVAEAGEVTLETGGKIPDSTEESLAAGGVYYWQATYKGDSLHQESTSECGPEVLAVCDCEAEGFVASLSRGEGLFATSFPAPSAMLPAKALPTRRLKGSMRTDHDPLMAEEVAVLTDRGISHTRATEAIEVQSWVSEADLVRKLQAAMGSGYAGVWFDNQAAQLHVGITSATSRRAAEQTVASTGLGEVVTYTAVHSTTEELLAIQRQWIRKLATLSMTEDNSVAIHAERNSVVVTIDETISARKRASLIREAAASPVKVSIIVVLRQGARTSPTGMECNNFPPANCNPSITAGVKIERPAEEIGKGAGKSYNKGGKEFTLDSFAPATLANVVFGDEVTGPGIPAGTVVTALPNGTSVTISQAATIEGAAEFTFSTGYICSAGPLAIPTANRAQRVVLTAGHCIAKGHGVGAKWFAYNRGGAKSQIGTAIAFKVGGAAGAKIGEFGDISIEAAWQTGRANTPVLAVTARWDKNRETRYPIVGEKVPVENATNCHEGQTSGNACGSIEGEPGSVVSTFWGRTMEGLVEDSAKAAAGDSGGDWFGTNGNGQVEVEGTMVGIRNTGQSIYQPLTKLGAGKPPGSLEELNLILLTTRNEDCK